KAAVHLQVPAVEAAAPPHDRARLAERGLDRGKLLFRRLPLPLPRRRERARPGELQLELSATAPGREAVLQAPDEPGKWLQKMQQRRHGEEPGARRSCRRRARERGGGRAE